MKRIIAVCMLMVLIVSQTACTFSRNNDRAVIPGSSITPAPGAAKEIKGDGENPTLTGVLTLRDADTGRMRFVEQNMKSLIQAVQIFRMLTER